MISGSVHSEQPDKQEITIFLSTRASNREDPYSFVDVINSSIAYKLKTAGFGIIVNKNNRSIEDLLQLAHKQGASFLIDSKYSTDNDFLRLTLNCFRIADGINLKSISEKSKINLDLDSFIQKKSIEIISIIKKDIVDNPPIIQPITESKEIIEKEVIVASTTEDVAKNEDADRYKEPVKFRHFTISTGFIPFMTTGNASDYFTFGMGPSLHLDYNFQTLSGYFGIGLYSSLIYFIAEGLLTSSENLLISAGPEFKLGIDANPFLGIFLQLNGGGTLFMMNRNNEGYLSTIIPFISGGMGVTMNIVPWFGVAISTNYSLYIENSILITGFSPSTCIYLRL